MRWSRSGVVVAGAGDPVTGALWIDPVTSLVIVAVIAWGTWGLLKDSVKMGLLAVPDGIDEGEVRALLAGLPGVAAVHDLHIWPMSTTETALTAHLVMPAAIRATPSCTRWRTSSNTASTSTTRPCRSKSAATGCERCEGCCK